MVAQTSASVKRSVRPELSIVPRPRMSRLTVLDRVDVVPNTSSKNSQAKSAFCSSS
jgi:hypothetical protein